MHLFACVARWRARRHKLARLQHALLALPETDRHIYLLCTAGPPQDAVAQRLGLEVEDVQERLARALLALAAILDETPRPAVARDAGTR